MATNWMDYGTTDARKIAGQNRTYITEAGQGLQDKENYDADAAGQQANQTQSTLDQWMQPLASGQGGYNASETSQIQMTPEQQQTMNKAAGITAGATTAAATGAAQRAANAAGGSPEAVAAYRDRAARTSGSDAADAMTKARVATSDAAATRAENIGGQRIAQQNTGLNYYSGLQSQQAQEKENALNRVAQTYGTQASAMNDAAKLGISASQTPSTFDKVTGAVTTAAKFLDEGDVMPGDTPAVVAEGGPEKVVDMNNNGTRRYFDDGGFNVYDEMGQPVSSASGAPVAPGTLPDAAQPAQNTGFLAKLKTGIQDNLNQLKQGNGAGQQKDQGGGGQQWSPVDTYKGIGEAAGDIGKLFLQDGGVANAMPKQGANGIFTEPTRVNLQPGEAVVPLHYRARAKTRPSMAALPAAENIYRGASHGGRR